MHLKNSSKKYFIYGMVALILIFVTAFFMQKGETMDECLRTAGELEKAARVELFVGSETASITEFLVRHQIEYTYDRFAERYQGITRAVKNMPGTDCAVTTYIYVDKKGRYIKSEFIATYTGV